MGKIEISGPTVDTALVLYVEKNGGLVATIDSELKKRIKQAGGSIVSLASDRIVLES